ncbi:aminotransferase class I/II-fold pyridoxal phosphate-dependent enzyme [candidate division FCPU426 bacterium]|nr:aminotransferase class I/II-fold pyridoxal phosphate-dependent enzyme [candidate division FCPU426 bacterium]
MDIFEKAYNYHAAEDVRKLGLYPYFRMNETAVDTTTIMNGRRTVMIGSNNYLGLTSHPEVKEAAIKAVEKYGTGCTGSRFLNGTIDLHVELEEKLARFMKKEAALVYTTGFTTNQGVLSTLVQKGDVVISDRTNHASILDGCRLAYGKLIKFRHNDMEDLERILVNLKDKEAGKLVIVDGVFSMEGDVADLKHIMPLAEKYGARVMVDEAHGLGVLGKYGRGACEELGVLDKADIVMGTFSKAFASVGGFIATEARVIDFLKHNSRAFIFQAAPPPAAVASALKALEILQREPERLVKLRQNVSYMLKEIKAYGFRTWPTESAIIPIIIGEDLKTFQFSKMLEEEGVYVNPVVSPAVAPGWACIRTSYTATHKREELDFALEKLKKVGTALGIIGPNAPGAPVETVPVPMSTGARKKALPRTFPLLPKDKDKDKGENLQKTFLKLPWAIYRQDKNWVPPMITELETLFDKEENIFYEHGEAQAFLAKRGSEVVGRIVAAIDHRANKNHGEEAGFFGFFEVDRDYGAAESLLHTAREWLTERGMKVMRGPMAFSQLDGMGCLVEGFDFPPAIMMPYNPEYYPEFYDTYGLQKVQDLYAYQLDAKSAIPKRLEKLAEHTHQKEGVEIRRLRMSRFRRDMATIMEILNDINSEELGFTPLTKRDLKYFSAKLKPVIEPDLVNFVEVQGKAVAFSMLLPDYNEVLKRFNGHVGVTDMLKFYLYSKKIKTVRFTMLGVKKAYRRRGLETLLYLKSFQNAKELGYSSGELSWVPEGNKAITKAIESNGGKRYKVYRVYELKI